MFWISLLWIMGELAGEGGCGCWLLAVGTSMALQRHCNGTSMALQWHFNGTSTALKRHFKGTSKTKNKNVIGASIHIGRESQCHPYLGFFLTSLLGQNYYIISSMVQNLKFSRITKNTIISVSYTSSCKSFHRSSTTQ